MNTNHEVWRATRLDLPRQVKIGETTEARRPAEFVCSPGDGKMVLREKRQSHRRTNRCIMIAGKNRYTLPLYFREPGYYDNTWPRLNRRPGRDGWQENNTAINFLYLKGEGKVLLVTGPARRSARLGNVG